MSVFEALPLLNWCIWLRNYIFPAQNRSKTSAYSMAAFLWAGGKYLGRQGEERVGAACCREHSQQEEHIRTTASTLSERCWGVFVVQIYQIDVIYCAFLSSPSKMLHLFEYIFYFIAHYWRYFTQWGPSNIMQFPRFHHGSSKWCLSASLQRPSKNWTQALLH